MVIKERAEMAIHDMNGDNTLPEVGKVFSILLAGGTGSRLWPVSRELYPKQLVRFIGDNSFVQLTIKRIEPLLDIENVRIICGKEHFHETAKHMESIGIDPEGKIICEPCGRNTAPAILYALLNILKKDKDPVLCVFPADHVIDNGDKFLGNLKSAIKLASSGYIVAFGITPHYPETGYGYVEGGDTVSEGALTIKKFIEKPELSAAKAYVKAGNFFWNSGMFAFKASVMMEEFKTYQEEMIIQMDQIVSKGDFPERELYEQLTDISIDHAIMEKTKKGVVLPSEFGWSDIGSWKSLYDFLPKDDHNNDIDGDVIAKDTKNSFIMGRNRLIATNHINNLIVIETPDSVFVSDIDNSRDVKSIVENLKETGRKEYQQHRKVHHSWGSFKVLEHKEDYYVSRVIVYPAAIFEIHADAFSLKRLDVIKGRAEILMDSEKYVLSKGESTTILGNKHATVKNTGNSNLYMIEVYIKNESTATRS
ncbi:MAG: mannose-1-phosphate guanylyltransferase/mannose-6-phosphate isomerase [Desulfobacterales bacterium]|nr:mannose-1-phosphate guanylyltransferase/mannose-6-phosphate isomerase [Desulfobacterales bacterium]